MSARSRRYSGSALARCARLRRGGWLAWHACWKRGAPVTDLEDRLRQALSTEAERAQPEMVRPLRAPRAPAARGWLATPARPGRRWPGGAAPLAAAAAVMAVVAGSAAISSAIHGRRAATGAGPAHRVIAYVAASGSEAVIPIRTATNTALPPVNVGSNPDFLAITPDGKTLYVANYRY